MTRYRFRPFRNSDPPALADLWNRALPDRGVVRPLTVHEFDTLVIGKLPFERGGLIVAERVEDHRVVGFAHAGFGPAELDGPSHRLDREMGTIAMVAIETGLDDEQLDLGLMNEAIAYLRGLGARVVYAGGQHPLDPFYWGLYGGSEFSGILEEHRGFVRAVMRSGFQPIATTQQMELDLTGAEARDPRSVLLRRQARIETIDDALPENWWQSLAIGLFRPTRFRLLDRATGFELAHAMTWDIASGFGVGDGRPRTGMIQLEVHPEHRRKGYGRLLVSEIARHARDQLAEVLTIQMDSMNESALSLYRSLGFTPSGTGTLFRLPG